MDYFQGHDLCEGRRGACRHGSVHSLHHLTAWGPRGAFHVEFHPRYMGAVDALKTLQWGDLRQKMDEERGEERTLCVPPSQAEETLTEEPSGVCISVARLLLLFITQLYPTLCDPMDCSTPGFPVLHYLLELIHTHVHWVSHPTISSCPTLLLCPQSFPESGSSPVSPLFTSGGQSTGVSASASILPMSTQD